MYDYVTKGWRDLAINMSSPWIYLKGTRVINHPVNSVRSVLVFTAHIIIISPDTHFIAHSNTTLTGFLSFEMKNEISTYK